MRVMVTHGDVVFPLHGSRLDQDPQLRRLKTIFEESTDKVKKSGIGVPVCRSVELIIDKAKKSSSFRLESPEA